MTEGRAVALVTLIFLVFLMLGSGVGEVAAQSPWWGALAGFAGFCLLAWRGCRTPKDD